MEKENKKKNKYSLEFILDYVTEGFITIIKKLNKLLTNKKQNIIIKSCIRIIFCLLILRILEIPFFVVEKIGVGLIYFLSTTFREIWSSTWCAIIDYTYVIFSLIVIFRVIYNMSRKDDYKIEGKKINETGNELYNTAFTVLRVLISLALIPLYLLVLLLFMILGMWLYFITHGVFIIGPILVTIGLIIIIVASLSYVYEIALFDKGGNTK